MRSTTLVAAAAAALPIASAMRTASSGGLKVINRCKSDFPYSMIGDPNGGAQDSTGTLKGNGGTFFTNWIQLNAIAGPNLVGGWSLKINTINDATKPMQIEYTWPAANLPYVTGEDVAWDVSYVDLPEAFYDQTPVFHLDAGSILTHDNFYRWWNDDHNGMQPSVPNSQVATVFLCPVLTDYASGILPAGYTPDSSAASPKTATTLQTTTKAATLAPIIDIKKADVVTTTSSAAPPPATTKAVTTAATTPAAAPAPAPAPATSAKPSTTAVVVTTPAAAPAPAPTQASDDVVVTEYVTAVVTAFVTEVAKGPGHRRRHVHGHGHNHGHQH